MSDKTLVKCGRCNNIPECGPVQCEICRVEGCDYCVPETDCGHSICFSCLEAMETAAWKAAHKRIEQLEGELGTICSNCFIIKKDQVEKLIPEHLKEVKVLYHDGVSLGSLEVTYNREQCISATQEALEAMNEK